MTACKGRNLRKKSGGCDTFGSVSKGFQTDVQSVHTCRESEGPLSWCSSYFAYHFIVHVSVVVHTMEREVLDAFS